MKILFFIWFGLHVLTLSGQEQFVYYLTGRPFSVEYNNAILTVGEKWKISFQYAGNDVIEMKGLEKINSHNDSVSILIGNKTGLGEGWQNSFYTEVSMEEEKHQKIRKWIKEDINFLEIEQKLFESILLIEPKRCSFGKKYYVYQVGQLKTDETRLFYSMGKYRVNLKRKSVKLISEKAESLPFAIPQNGIQ